MLKKFEIFSNKTEIENKIKLLKNLDDLVFICDFDRTFTTHDAPATWGIFMYSHLFGDKFYKESEDLFNKYYPIEIGDYNIEYKSKKMLEWWNAALKILIDYKITWGDINNIVEKKDLVKFRPGSIDLLKFLHEKDIPIIFFSAGCGDVIKLLLEREGLYNHNLFIESNFFEYNEDNNEIIGFKNKDIIHPENKNTFPLLPHIQERIKNKNTCIILGDGPGDTKLEHLVTCENILKIVVKINSIENKLLKNAGFDILTKDYDFSGINNLFIR